MRCKQRIILFLVTVCQGAAILNEFAQQPNAHFQEAIKHSQEVVQLVRHFQIELADRSRQLDNEVREMAELQKRESYLNDTVKSKMEEKSTLEQQLWAVYIELHKNLDTGKPRSITKAKVKAETEQLKQELENFTMENARTQEAFSAEYAPIVFANEKLEQELKQQAIPQNFEETAKANVRYKVLLEMSKENDRLEGMNRKMSADNELLMKGIKFAFNPKGALTGEFGNKLAQTLPAPLEIHTSSFNCVPMLQVLDQEISKQKQENKQLQDGLQKLQSGDPEEELRDTINRFFKERGQLLEATAAFQRRESEIVNQLGAVISPLKLTGLLSNSTFTAKGSPDPQIAMQTTPEWTSFPSSSLVEIQQVHEVLQKLHTGIRTVQEYQHTTMRHIKDEAARLPNNFIGQQL